MLEADCLAANGMYQGNTILCINVTCDQPQWPIGACCLSDGPCVDDQTEFDCLTTGGFNYLAARGESLLDSLGIMSSGF